MGGPNGSIDVLTSVSGLTKVIENLNADQNGHFINYDGSPIPW
jgi:hypothetical protein